MAFQGGIRAGRAFLEIGADDTELQAKLKTSEVRLQRFATSAQSLGRTIGSFGAAITAPLSLAVQKASDAQESYSKFSALFRNLAGEARKFGEELALAVGRSSIDIGESLGTFQAFFVGLGFGNNEALKLSESLTQLAIDFGSFHNVSDDESLQRFIAALSGSGEVLDRFGVNIKAAALDQEFLSKGLKVTTATATEQQKVMARIAIITRSLGQQGAIGDAIRTAESFSNRMKSLAAAVKDAAVQIGSALLPALGQVVGGFVVAAKAVAAWAEDNQRLSVTAGVVGVSLTALGVSLVSVGAAATGAAAAINGASTAIALLSVTLLRVPLLPIVSTVIVAAEKFGLLDLAIRGVESALSLLSDAGTSDFTSRASALSGAKLDGAIEKARDDLGKAQRRLAFSQALESSGADGSLDVERDRVKTAREQLQVLLARRHELESQQSTVQDIAKLEADTPTTQDPAAFETKIRAERQVAQEIRNNAAEIASLQARMALTGHNLRMRLMEIEHTKELDDARAEGRNLSGVIQKQALERRLANKEQADFENEQRKNAIRDQIRNEHDEKNRLELSTSGTFSGALAQQSLGGTDLEQLQQLRMANKHLTNVERAVKNQRIGLRVGK